MRGITVHRSALSIGLATLALVACSRTDQTAQRTINSTKDKAVEMAQEAKSTAKEAEKTAAETAKKAEEVAKKATNAADAVSKVAKNETTKATETAKTKTTDVHASTVIPMRSLRPDQIRNVQSALRTKGAAIHPDGVAGPATTAALQHFQKQNGLPNTGKLTPATLEKLGLSPGDYRAAE